MQQRAYSVRDTKAGFYMNPFFATTQTEAERSFHQLANDTNTFVNKYPQDYDLYYVGKFDSDSGKLETLPTPEHIIKASDILRPSPKQDLTAIN